MIHICVNASKGAHFNYSVFITAIQTLSHYILCTLFLDMNWIFVITTRLIGLTDYLMLLNPLTFISVASMIYTNGTAYFASRVESS